MQSVDFYYSIGSRYSYLASSQIDALQKETGCHVEWHPINSVWLMAQREMSPFQGNTNGLIVNGMRGDGLGYTEFPILNLAGESSLMQNCWLRRVLQRSLWIK